MNAEALMPARACARTQAAYTFCCDTLTNRDNKHHAHPPVSSSALPASVPASLCHPVSLPPCPPPASLPPCVPP